MKYEQRFWVHAKYMAIVCMHLPTAVSRYYRKQTNTVLTICLQV